MTPGNNTESGRRTPETPHSGVQRAFESKATKAYVSPAILSHSGEDILEELGPAQACYPFNSCGVAP